MDCYVEKKKENLIDFDSRVKMILLIIMNLIMINVHKNGIRLYIKFIIFGMIFLLFLLNRRRKIALISLSLFALSWAMELTGLLDSVKGIAGFILAITTELIIRILPCALTGYYLISTTEVSKLIEGFRKMRIPEQINLPLAVIFRFIPSVIEEGQLISDAMKIRNVRLRKGISFLKLLEYKYIPLMMSTIKIGDELTVSALTKGLSVKEGRSCIHQLKFHSFDYMLLVISAILLILFMRG